MLRVYLQNVLIVAILGVAPAVAEPAQIQAESPFVEAERAFNKGDFTAALKSYQWFRVDTKLGPPARIKGGQCLLKLGKLPDAIREWRSVWKLWPDSPEAVTALALEIENTADVTARRRVEDLLLKEHADSAEAKALLAARAKDASPRQAELTRNAEVERLISSGNRKDAVKLMRAAARRATGDQRDRLLGQLAALYESSGDWRKAAGVWRKISEEGNPVYKEAATFAWIRTGAEIGGNLERVEDMWLKFLRDYPSSPRSHLAVTRLAELMVLQNRQDEAAELMKRWLSSAEDKSGESLVSLRLSELQLKLDAGKTERLTSFAKERLEAAAKLPEEIESLCAQARTGKGTGTILNRISDIRRGLRGLRGVRTVPVLLFQLDRAEALALVGQSKPKKALVLLDDSWGRNDKLLEANDAAVRKFASEFARDAIGVAMVGEDHSAAVAWAGRSAAAATPGDINMLGFIKETAIRLVLAGAKTEGIAVFSILESQVLAGFPVDSPTRREETVTVTRLKAICANGKPVRDNQWFVGEIPEGLDRPAARALFEADLLFATGDSEGASSAYGDVLRAKGLDQDSEGYATMQLARCLAALQKHKEALRIYRRFQSALGRTKSAAPALLRAGTLCAGPLNDSRRAQAFFTMVSTQYPDSPEAEICDWYSATLYLWAGNLRSARLAFEEFEKKHPGSALVQTLDKSIRPQL